MALRIGIDVGGTNTDAVLLDGDRLLATHKSPTTEDVTSGIRTALTGVLEREATLRGGDRPITPGDVDAVMIGTTHFINGLVQARGLTPTAVIRLGLPASASLPPFIDWPAELVQATKAQWFLAHGGHEYDGRPISAMRPDEIRSLAAQAVAGGAESIAISSVFSPVNADGETEAAELIRAEVGDDIHLTLSHRIGKVGLLERENAAIINAALRGLATQVVAGLRTALTDVGVTAPLFLSQNDGTLMSLETALQYPVATFASGPTNSIRGASRLSGVKDCAVIDIGGTTTDVGICVGGFPRESQTDVRLAGVRTNFRMPDVLSVGIGGGSLVSADGERIGPTSVGYLLPQKALVFGGDTLTATDIAVRCGMAEIGDPSLVAHIPEDVARRARDRRHRRCRSPSACRRRIPEPAQ